MTAYTDLKYGMVRNSLLLKTMLLAAPVQIAGCIAGYVSITHYITNIVCVTVLCGLWYIWGLWAAGDCKLLIAISLIYPYTMYWRTHISWFNSASMILFFISITYAWIIMDTLLNIIRNMDVLILTWKRIVNKRSLCHYAQRWLIIVAINNILSAICCTTVEHTFTYTLLPSLFLVLALSKWIDRIVYYWPVASVINIVFWIMNNSSPYYVFFSAAICFHTFHPV